MTIKKSSKIVNLERREYESFCELKVNSNNIWLQNYWDFRARFGKIKLWLEVKSKNFGGQFDPTLPENQNYSSTI